MPKIDKISWQDIRSQVALVNNDLYQLVERIPGQLPDLYLFSYHYGEDIVKNGVFNCCDAKAKQSIGPYPIPLALVLDKSVSYYTIRPDQDEKMLYLYLPGRLIGLRHFSQKSNKVFETVNISCGSRSVAITDKMSNRKNISKLERYFSLPLELPRTPNGQFSLFKQLSEVDEQLQQWQGKLVVFTQEWVDRMNNPDSNGWLQLLYYVLQASLKKRNRYKDYLVQLSDEGYLLAKSLSFNNIYASTYNVVEHIVLLLSQANFALSFYLTNDTTHFPYDRLQEILSTIYRPCDNKHFIFYHLDHISNNPGRSTYMPLNCLSLVLRSPLPISSKSNLSHLRKIQFILNKLKNIEWYQERLSSYHIQYFHSNYYHDDANAYIHHPDTIQNEPILNTCSIDRDVAYTGSFWKGLIQFTPTDS